jgi:nitrite reductase/ring-hydroxylating ferredoxin subunit
MEEAPWFEHELAPSPGTSLCRIDEIPDGDGKELVFGKSTLAFRMFVVRRGDSVWGYVNRCPHVSLTLNLFPNRFTRPGGDWIVCANHGAVFEIETGHCLAGPCAGESLSPIPLTLREGSVFIA